MPIMDAIDRVRNLELELEASKRAAGRVLRSTRKRLRMTMKQVSDEVKDISPATVHNTEKNKAWRTETAVKLARYYEKKSAA